MTDYTLMQLVNWLESVACKCYYVFEGLYVKPRCMTHDRKEKRKICWSCYCSCFSFWCEGELWC